MVEESPSPVAEKPVWNTLEIAKLVVGILTPLSLLFISSEFAQSERDRTEQTTRFERVAEQRTRLWQSLGPQLNDIYAYLMYVGRWKQMTASYVVTAKREADRVFYANRPFFSGEFVEAYESFMNASFQTFNDMGQDAKPRTTAIYREQDSNDAVAGHENSDAVHSSYYQLLDVVAEEFGLTVSPPQRPSTPSEVSDQRSKRSP